MRKSRMKKEWRRRGEGSQFIVHRLRLCTSLPSIYTHLRLPPPCCEIPTSIQHIWISKKVPRALEQSGKYFQVSTFPDAFPSQQIQIFELIHKH